MIEAFRRAQRPIQRCSVYCDVISASSTSACTCLLCFLYLIMFRIHFPFNDLVSSRSTNSFVSWVCFNYSLTSTSFLFWGIVFGGLYYYLFRYRATPLRVGSYEIPARHATITFFIRTYSSVTRIVYSLDFIELAD